MKLIHLFILIYFFIILEYYNAQTNEPKIINTNSLHNLYKQSNPDIFPDSNKGFITTWDDYRSGEKQKYAYRFDANANKIGNEINIKDYHLISYSTNSKSFGIFEDRYSYTWGPYDDVSGVTFMGKYFDETIETESINLGGGTFPWCGTGWLGYGYSLSRYGNEFIYSYDFGGWYSIFKIYSDGKDSLIISSDYDENQYLQVSSGQTAVNKLGEYVFVYFYSSDFDSTSGIYVKTFAESDTLISMKVIESFEGRDEYDYWGYRKLIKVFSVSDSLFQIVLIDSLKLKTFRIDKYGNMLNKKNYPIYKTTGENYYFDNYSNNFTISNFSDESINILISIEDNRNKNNTLFVFDKRGELINEPILDSTFNYQLGKSFFKNEDNQLLFTTASNNSIYLVKYDNFALIDSVEISKPIANSNEVKPAIKKYKNGFFIEYNNELKTKGIAVSNKGTPTSEEIELNTKGHQFFSDGSSLVIWNNTKNYTEITSGFSIYDEKFNIIKIDTLFSGIPDKYGFCSGSISPNDEIIIVFQNVRGVFIAKYSKDGIFIKQNKIDLIDSYKRWAKIFYENSTIFVNWNRKIYTIDSNLELTNISENTIFNSLFTNWKDGKFGGFSTEQNFGKVYYFLYNSNADTLNSMVTLEEGILFTEIKVGYVKPNQFLVMFKTRDEIFTQTFNSLGKKTINKFVIHKIENETIRDVSFEVNGDKIVFTWSGKKNIDDNFDIYSVMYDLDILTDVEKTSNDSLPNEFQLFQNYPNPFNPSTVIKFSITSEQLIGTLSQMVTLSVFDILGRKVATLVNEQKRPGYYKIIFDATYLSSGIYYYQLCAGSFIKTKKMILIK